MKSIWNGPVLLGLSQHILRNSLTSTQSPGFRSCSRPVAGVGRAYLICLWTEFTAEETVAHYFNITSSHWEVSGRVGFTCPIPMFGGHPNNISKRFMHCFSLSLICICIRAMGSTFVHPKPVSGQHLSAYFSMSHFPSLLPPPLAE